MTRADKAKELFIEGYNCSQAVAAAFCDLIGMDEKTVVRLVSGYGGGMGRMREVCGAFSGVVFIISALYGYDEKQDFEGKKQLYSIIQELAGRFRKEHGTIVCRELLGLDKNSAVSPVPEKRTEEFFKKRPCPEIIYTAAKILEEYLKEQS